MGTPESRWIARAKRMFKEMPPTLEVVAYEGEVAVCETGALRKFLDTNASWGTAETIESIRHRRIHTHSESL